MADAEGCGWDSRIRFGTGSKEGSFTKEKNEGSRGLLVLWTEDGGRRTEVGRGGRGRRAIHLLPKACIQSRLVVTYYYATATPDLASGVWDWT